MHAEFTIPLNKVCMQRVLPLIHVNCFVFSNSSVFSVFNQAVSIYHSVSQTFIAYGTLVAFKNKHRSSHPCSVESMISIQH